ELCRVLNRVVGTHARSSVSSTGAVHQLDDARELVGVGFRRYAVAEVDDVRACRAAAIEHVEDVSLEYVPRCLQQRRVDISLNGDVRSENAGGFIERLPPVDTYGGCRAVKAHVVQEGSCAH